MYSITKNLNSSEKQGYSPESIACMGKNSLGSFEADHQLMKDVTQLTPLGLDATLFSYAIIIQTMDQKKQHNYVVRGDN